MTEKLPELKEFSDFTTFTVLGNTVNVLSFTTDQGISTVAEIGSRIYHLGDLPGDVSTAIVAWQYEYKRFLTDDEFQKTIDENW